MDHRAISPMNTAELPPATLRLRIDTDALAANWRVLDNISGKASAGAAVKADAYGLGVNKAVPALRDAGCRQFYVAHWSEVAGVLQHVPAGQVAVLHGVGSAADVAYAKATGAVPVINSVKQATLWHSAGGGRCHLMIDTGINRLGIAAEDSVADAIAALEVDLLLSHLASADEDSALNALQLQRFTDAAAHVAHNGKSLANSAGICLGSDYHFDQTRPGLALYGGVPRGELEGKIAQVAWPEAAVMQRRRIGAGESVGYNAFFTADRDMEVATVSLGYADGFLRVRGKDCALHNYTHKFPILGRVSMDMVVVDCSADYSLSEGDFLQVPFDLLKISRKCGLSQYELITTIGSRFQVCA